VRRERDRLFKKIYEDTMTLGTHLTVTNYLGTRKCADIWDQQWRLIKKENLAGYKNFNSMLISCFKGQKANGLTAADYLANPVTVKPESITTYLETSLEMRLGQIRPYSQIQGNSTKSHNFQKEHKNEKEKAEDNSALEDIERSINRAARKYDLSCDLIRGIIKAESDFQVSAESSAGAMGLMQLMPATAKELGVGDPYDIDQNIDGGTRYLRKMLDRFGNDFRMALAAYNAGPGTVERYNGSVPYEETKQYVERVIGFAGLDV